jgi:ketosteroid isomerase-like protein
MNTTSDFQQFMQHRDAAARAYVNGDPAPVEGLATDTAPATFFAPGGGTVTEPAEVATAFREGAQAFADGGDSALEVLQAQASGDLAFWCGLQRATIRMKSDASLVEMTLRITEVFRREGSEWKLVHRHANALEPQAG